MKTCARPWESHLSTPIRTLPRWRCTTLNASPSEHVQMHTRPAARHTQPSVFKVSISVPDRDGTSKQLVLARTLLHAELLTDTKLLAYAHGWGVLATGALLTLTQCDTCVAKAWFLAAVMLWTSWRWRFKLTERQLAKLQWGEEQEGSAAADLPDPLIHTSRVVGSEVSTKHGVPSDYAVRSAVHSEKEEKQKPSRSQAHVSVQGRAPGKLLHFLPPLLQHLARTSAAREASRTVFGSSSTVRHSDDCAQCASGRRSLRTAALIGWLTSTVIIMSRKMMHPLVSSPLAVASLAALLACSWFMVYSHVQRRVSVTLGHAANKVTVRSTLLLLACFIIPLLTAAASFSPPPPLYTKA